MNEDCPPDASDGEENGINERQQQIEEPRRSALETLAVLCDELSEMNISQIRLNYDGYGDEGTIDEVTALAGEKTIELEIPWRDRLRAVGYELLPGGWQDGHGAFGELVINVATRKLTREHSWRVEDSEYEEETIDI